MKHLNNKFCECLDYCEKADPFSVTPKGKCREESAVEVCENGADTRTKHVSPASKSCSNFVQASLCTKAIREQEIE